MAFAGLRTDCRTCCDDDCIICISGFNGEYEECQYTIVSGYWEEADSKLTGTGAGLVTFNEAPPLTTDPVKVSVTAESLDPYDGTFWLIAGWVDEDNYVFGELKIESGVVTMRVGQNGSYLTEAQEIGDYLEGPHRVELCWRPPVEQETTEHVLGGIFPTSATGGGAMPLVPFSSPENILALDGSNAISEVQVPGFPSTGPLTAFWFPLILPEGATIDGIGISVHLRGGDEYTPIHDIGATLTAGGVVLEDQATNAPIPTDLGTMSYGGATDLWGAAEISTEGINQFGVSFTAQYSIPTGTPEPATTTVEVDAVEIVIWFTTRADIPGRLTMTVSGTQGNTCSTAYDVDGQAGKPGLQIIEGDWEFDSFRHEYLASGPHPGCEVCDCGFVPHPDPSQCSCCAEYSPPYASIILNLSGGWTADACTGCGTVTGTYELTALRVTCAWQYTENIPCGISECSFGTGLLTITAYIEPDPADGLCRWKVIINIISSTISDPSDPTNGCQARADYQSDPLSGDCQTFPLTLNRISDIPGALCDGAMPLTITLDAPI